jgi:hypothetical protein
MPGKRPNEPIGPTNVPGGSIDPKIPPDDTADDTRDDSREHLESEQEQQARVSEKAFDEAITRMPPG